MSIVNSEVLSSHWNRYSARLSALSNNSFVLAVESTARFFHINHTYCMLSEVAIISHHNQIYHFILEQLLINMNFDNASKEIFSITILMLGPNHDQVLPFFLFFTNIPCPYLIPLLLVKMPILKIPSTLSFQHDWVK